MKRFQKETRGMLPDSSEVKLIRNRIYDEMRNIKHREIQKARQAAQGQTVHEGSITADFNSYYNLLIVVPEKLECYETVATLNFFGFPFDIEEENMFGHSKKDMGFAKDSEYPLLLIDSNTEEMPACDVTSKDQILRHLQQIGLIGDFRTQSAYENLGLKFIEEQLEPAITDLYRNFLPIC